MWLSSDSEMKMKEELFINFYQHAKKLFIFNFNENVLKKETNQFWQWRIFFFLSFFITCKFFIKKKQSRDQSLSFSLLALTHSLHFTACFMQRTGLPFFSNQAPTLTFPAKTLATLYWHSSTSCTYGMLIILPIIFCLTSLSLTFSSFSRIKIFSSYSTEHRHEHVCKWRWLTLLVCAEKKMYMSFLIKPSINHHRNTHIKH